MQLEIRLDMGEGEISVQPSLFAIVEWERKYKTKVGADLGLEDLLFLAYTQLKAEKTVILPPTFDDFCRKVTTLTTSSGDDDPRPTGAATDTPSA